MALWNYHKCPWSQNQTGKWWEQGCETFSFTGWFYCFWRRCL